MAAGRRLGLREVLVRLGRVDWRGLGIEWVALYGSLARRGLGGYVDLLVYPGRGGSGSLM